MEDRIYDYIYRLCRKHNSSEIKVMPVFVNMSALAEKAGVTRKTVNRCIQSLIEKQKLYARFIDRHYVLSTEPIPKGDILVKMCSISSQYWEV